MEGRYTVAMVEFSRYSCENSHYFDIGPFLDVMHVRFRDEAII